MKESVDIQETAQSKDGRSWRLRQAKGDLEPLAAEWDHRAEKS